MTDADMQARAEITGAGGFRAMLSPRHMTRLALVVIAAVLALSAAASLGYGPRYFTFVHRIPGRDVTLHFLVMGLLALVVNLAFASSRLLGRRLGVVGCTSLVLIFVTLEELLQKLIPARRFSLQDLSASYAGVLVAAIIAFALLAWLPPRDSPRV